MESPSQRNMIITYTKVNQKQQKNDFTYWQKQPYLERLAALEQIRQDYYQKYPVEPRLQRIYRIIKQ